MEAIGHLAVLALDRPLPLHVRLAERQVDVEVLLRHVRRIRSGRLTPAEQDGSQARRCTGAQHLPSGPTARSTSPFPLFDRIVVILTHNGSALESVGPYFIHQ
ncbi:hypothetical protein [Halomicrobium urmianum]|uniref:hypothetical protein n=1 Tax=Halomicrobium urmianum TaxID=1586233 RepID=UPI0035710426